MAALHHDNIQDVRGYCILPEEGPALVSKYYVRGSLVNLFKSSPRRFPDVFKELHWGRRLRMASDIAAGMLCMHSKRPPLIHRDLKAVNCFVDENWTALVGDFGLTKEFSCGSRVAASSGLGANNPRWLAPELMDGKDAPDRYTTASDMYGYGATLYELLTWRVPWYNDNMFSIQSRVQNGERPPVPPLERLPGPPGDVAAFQASGGLDRYLALMARCWAQDPAARPSFAEVHAELQEMIKQHDVATGREEGSSHADPRA